MRLNNREDVIEGYALLVLRNEDLKEKAKTRLDARYYEGFADCARACMLVLFYDKWGPLHDDKWLWLQVNTAVDNARPRFEREKNKRRRSI